MLSPTKIDWSRPELWIPPCAVIEIRSKQVHKQVNCCEMTNAEQVQRRRLGFVAIGGEYFLHQKVHSVRIMDVEWIQTHSVPESGERFSAIGLSLNFLGFIILWTRAVLKLWTTRNLRIWTTKFEIGSLIAFQLEKSLKATLAPFPDRLLKTARRQKGMKMIDRDGPVLLIAKLARVGEAVIASSSQSCNSLGSLGCTIN